MTRSLEDAALGPLTRWLRIALVAGLAWWTIRFARTPLGPDINDSFLHLPNLVSHEAGHIVFSPLGAYWVGVIVMTASLAFAVRVILRNPE
jgi:hypothetical protein